MRKILITNDDGICADGIIRLAEAAKNFGEVWVVAPHEQRSAASHSITLRQPIEAVKTDFPVDGVRAFYTNGSPADCVRVGCLNIVKGKPDVVLSGINDGYNLGTDLQYSATAGAAFEGSFQGIHSIALSENFGDDHAVTDRYLLPVLEEMLKMPFERGYIWNVNFPGGAVSGLQGILRDRAVSMQSFFSDTYDEEIMPDGSFRYMVNGAINSCADEGTDLRAIYDGYISIGRARNIS